MALLQQLETQALTPELPLVIYGVALLAGCMLAGLYLGDVLGLLIGVEANVGGVGLAMILLILLSDRLRKTGRLSTPTEQGVLFWSAIYIPVVVAMAAKQNVIAAVKGGPAAILAGVGAVALSFLLVPVLSKVGRGGGASGEVSFEKGQAESASRGGPEGPVAGVAPDGKPRLDEAVRSDGGAALEGKALEGGSGEDPAS